ncbi:MAG: putative N-acetyltransferase YjcF, partial [Alphaproteobacteria bacterium]|nr:putative N-acetyltransferase YjcF [Alphaproteobacteria bacterium]
MVSISLTERNLNMAQSQRMLADIVPLEAVRAGRHKLNEMDAARIARHLVMFPANEEQVRTLLARARPTIPGLAATEDVLRVVRHNPDCMMAVARRSRFKPEAPEGEGFFAMLPLTELGLKVLALGALNTSKPDLRLIARPDERPAGIYMWAVFAPGPLAAGSALFMERMAGREYAGVNLYTRPNTDPGRRFNEVLGIVQGAKVGELDAPQLWVFDRKQPMPLYDSYQPGARKGEIGVTIARTFEDLSRVVAIRSAVYIGEQECPYDEEYDGNDLAATHLLAYIGDEPVGCLRIRFFADFAKIERLAIRKEFRKTRAAFQLVRAGFKLC